MPTSAPAPAETRPVAIDLIHESPKFNPRQRFRDLEDLARSLTEMGQIEPVVARPHPELEGEFELAVGSRRHRAAKIAGLGSLLTTIRPLTDLQMLEVAVVENNQRSDLHPVEEGRGFQMLLDAYREVHGEKAWGEMVAKVGRSEDYVRLRLRIAGLPEPIRDGFLADTITQAVALQLSRIGPDLQVPAFRELEKRIKEGGPKFGAVDQLEFLRRTYMLRLADAPFSRTDGKLVPEAGSCSACPYRTGNQRELLDVDGAVSKDDSCTQPACYAKKREAHWQQVCNAARKAGHALMPDKDARKYFGLGGKLLAVDVPYVDLDDVCRQDGEGRTFRALLGEHVPPITVGRDEFGKAHELVWRDDLPGALSAAVSEEEARKITQRLAAEARMGAAGKRTEEDETPKKDEAAERLHKGAMGAVVARVVEAVQRQTPGASFWVAMVRGIMVSAWHDTVVDVARRRGLIDAKSYPRTEIEKRIVKLAEELPEKQARGLAAELVIARGAYNVAVGGDLVGAEALVAVAAAVGSDAKRLLRDEKQRLEKAGLPKGEEPTASSPRSPRASRNKAAKKSARKPGKKAAKKRGKAAQSEEAPAGSCPVCECTEDEPCELAAGTCRRVRGSNVCTCCVQRQEEILGHLRARGVASTSELIEAVGRVDEAEEDEADLAPARELRRTRRSIERLEIGGRIRQGAHGTEEDPSWVLV